MLALVGCEDPIDATSCASAIQDRVGTLELVVTSSLWGGGYRYPYVRSDEPADFDAAVRPISGALQRSAQEPCELLYGAEIPDDFVWTSSDPGVAAVDQIGIVRAVGTGFFTITVRATRAGLESQIELVAVG